MTKQSTAGHTELPWETDKISVRSTGPAGRQICLCDITVRGKPYEQTYDEALANANLIVTAVNTYPAVTELVAALEAIQQFCDDPNGSDSSETLAEGLSRLLPQARSALAHYRELAGTNNEGAK